MTKDLAVAVFGRQVLATHGLSGKKGNANKGTTAKPPLDSTKVNLILGNLLWGNIKILSQKLFENCIWKCGCLLLGKPQPMFYYDWSTHSGQYQWRILGEIHNFLWRTSSHTPQSWEGSAISGGSVKYTTVLLDGLQGYTHAAHLQYFQECPPELLAASMSLFETRDLLGTARNHWSLSAQTRKWHFVSTLWV